MPEPDDTNTPAPAPLPPPPPPPARADTLRSRIPNGLTIGRIALALLFFAVLTFWQYPTSAIAQGRVDWWLILAAILFILAAGTDYLDGFLARRWNVVSTFGRIMDPFADKLLVIGGFVFLAGPSFTVWRAAGDAGQQAIRFGGGPITAVESWMVVVILGRELLVTSVRATMESRGIDFSASISGKLKMVLQSITIPAILILLNLPVPAPASPDVAGWLIRFLVWATVVVTIWSGVPYVVRAITTVRELGRLPWHPLRAGLTPVGEVLITSGYLGRMRPFPGTWGSIPSVLIAALLIIIGLGPAHSPVAYNFIMVAIAAGFMFVCAIWADAAEARFRRKDPSEVVADETSGQAMALLFIPASAVATPALAAFTLIFAFVAFRAMDILKPYPAFRIQRLPGGWGVVLDDLVAGVYALLIVQFVTRAALWGIG